MQRVAAYFRTSSTANKDGDSLPRQRDAVQEYAARNQMTIEVTRHDVKTGNSAIEERAGFADLIPVGVGFDPQKVDFLVPHSDSVCLEIDTHLEIGHDVQANY